MKATIVSYRRGRHTNNPNQVIVVVEGVKDRKTALKLVGKKIVAAVGKDKRVTGTVLAAHGNKGRVRAKFNRNLPAERIPAEIIE